MKTDDLIGALAADRVVERHAVGRALLVAMPLGLLAAAGFLGMEGLRQGLTSPETLAIVLRKLACTGSLAVVAGVFALRGARPQGDSRALVLLAVPFAVLAWLVVGEIARLGLADWRARMMGEFSWLCTLAIAVMAAPLLAAFLWAMSRGAAERPAFAGALAGLAAAGIAASVYALHCTDDSALFVLTWYGLAGALAAGAGALAGRRALAW